MHSLADDVCTLDNHEFATGTPIVFAGYPPAELTEGVTYYAQRVTDSTFRVRATADGAALALTDVTDPVVVFEPLPKDEAIEWASAIIDDLLSAHQVPLDPIPEIVRFTCAELAAGKLLAMRGATSRSMAEIVDGARQRLARWAKGVPVQGSDTDTRANLTVLGSVTADNRGWRCHGRF